MAEARIFQEMQASDAMRQGILNRLRESGTGKAIGQAYDSDIAKGAVGGLRDAFRRIFEQGWHGKDVFDGRWHMDNNVGQGKEDMSVEGMDKVYGQASEFYGREADTTNDNGVQANEPEPEEEQKYEMEPEEEQEMEP